MKKYKNCVIHHAWRHQTGEPLVRVLLGENSFYLQPEMAHPSLVDFLEAAQMRVFAEDDMINLRIALTDWSGIQATQHLFAPEVET